MRLERLEVFKALPACSFEVRMLRELLIALGFRNKGVGVQDVGWNVDFPPRAA